MRTTNACHCHCHCWWWFWQTEVCWCWILLTANAVQGVVTTQFQFHENNRINMDCGLCWPPKITLIRLRRIGSVDHPITGIDHLIPLRLGVKHPAIPLRIENHGCLSWLTAQFHWALRMGVLLDHPIPLEWVLTTQQCKRGPPFCCMLYGWSLAGHTTNQVFLCCV
jgi:hypothetical protein